MFKSKIFIHKILIHLATSTTDQVRQHQGGRDSGWQSQTHPGPGLDLYPALPSRLYVCRSFFILFDYCWYSFWCIFVFFSNIICLSCSVLSQENLVNSNSDLILEYVNFFDKFYFFLLFDQNITLVFIIPTTQSYCIVLVLKCCINLFGFSSVFKWCLISQSTFIFLLIVIVRRNPYKENH